MGRLRLERLILRGDEAAFLNLLLMEQRAGRKKGMVKGRKGAMALRVEWAHANGGHEDFEEKALAYTLADFTKRLGLVDFFDFTIAAQAHARSQPHLMAYGERQTGRTTKNLLMLLVHVWYWPRKRFSLYVANGMECERQELLLMRFAAILKMLESMSMVSVKLTRPPKARSLLRHCEGKGARQRIFVDHFALGIF